MLHKQYLFACALLLTTCYVANEPSNDLYDREIPDATDVSESDVRQTSEPNDSLSYLDSLTQEQAHAVCMKATDLSSQCLKYALRKQTTEACEAFMRDCDTPHSGIDRYAFCDNVSYGESGTCAITESQYLNCVEAFNKYQRCEYVGKVIITPEPCFDVVRQCEALSEDFGRPPEIIQSCRDIGDRTGESQHDRDIYGAESCFPRPSRMVVLGDSISTCSSNPYSLAFSEDSIEVAPCECYWRNVASYLRDNYAPDLLLEGHYPGEPAGRIQEVVEYAQTIMGGPGHVLVWVSAVAHDLLRLRDQIHPGDENAPSLESAVEDWRVDWQKLFDYFTDRSRFPDGVTFMLNTLYSPTDQCPESEKRAILLETPSIDEENAIQYANQKLLIDSAREREDTVTVDMYPDWLGHGNNYNVTTCPFYSPDKASWISDSIHPNAMGYLHMGNKWKRAIDRMYKDNCR